MSTDTPTNTPRLFSVTYTIRRYVVDVSAAEAVRLREEAAKAEATVAGLRARAAALETLAQPPATRDPALDGDAKTTSGDHELLHPDMFGGTDYPEVGL